MVVGLINIILFLGSLYLHRNGVLRSKMVMMKDLVVPAAFTGKWTIPE